MKTEMGVPSRRVTEREMAEKAEVGLNRLAKERGISREEIDRRITECRLPFNPMRPLGYAVQAHRKERRLTRKKLAERSGISLTTLVLLERGNLKDISLANLINLAFALQVSVDAILIRAGWRDFLDANAAR
jgi:DNA-binding Xre family transcriptional regulator